MKVTIIPIVIQPIDRTLSGDTTLSHREPGSDGNEGVLRTPQSSSITAASPLGCLISSPEHSLVGSYPSAKKQFVYSTAPANWAIAMHIFTLLSVNEILLLRCVDWSSNFRGLPLKMEMALCSSNATNNLTSKKQKVCSLCYRHAEIKRKGRKRCDLFYGRERDKPT